MRSRGVTAGVDLLIFVIILAVLPGTLSFLVSWFMYGRKERQAWRALYERYPMLKDEDLDRSPLFGHTIVLPEEERGQ